MKVQGMCFVTCWVLFSGCVTTKEAQVKSEAEDLYDPREDLASFYPGYFKHRKSAKARLEKIEKQLLEIERNGEDTTCARQLERELRWVISYTAHFEKFDARIEKLESLASGRTTDPDAKSQSPIDGSWGSCHDEWFFKLDVSSDALDDLSKAGMLPKYPVKFLDKINSPEKLITYLDSLLISNPSQSGKINRKELNYSVSAFLRTINRDRPPNYRYHPQLKETLRQYLLGKWQNQETGYWGPWYRVAGKVIKTDDLSMTFHFVSYLKGKVPHLAKIAATTYAIRNRPYPYGLMEEGDYTNHHNYDAVRLFRYGWDELTPELKLAISAEINKMVDWCLTESLQSDGSFKMSGADDSFADAFYFGVSFLDEVGFFDSKSNYWSDRQFPNAQEVRGKIRDRIMQIGGDEYMLRSALEKLEKKVSKS